jgi:hypothetical protein
MSLNINAIAGNYVIPKGYILARFAGNDYFEELGDTDSFTITVDVTRDERKDNRFAVARTSDSQVTDITVSTSFTLMQHTNRNRALGVMGSVGTLTQTAGTGVSVEFTDLVANQIYWLQRFDLTNVVVTDGAATDPVTYVSGVDYLVDVKSGFFQPLKDLEAVEITFGATAIADTAKRLKTGIGGNPDLQAEIIHVGNSLKGEKVFTRLWAVRLSPSGGRGYIGTERQGLEISGQAQIDTARALAEGDVDEFAFGYETTLAA